MSTAPLSLLAQLGQHRWTVSLLAQLALRNGGRFVELQHSLGISRESLSRTLESAVLEGWVMRNSGHGHPVRPEYILSDAGWAASPLCIAIAKAQADLALPPPSLSRWSLPVLHLVDQGERRFTALSRALPQSNPRGLTQSLKSMIGHQLLNRQIIDTYPPIPEYHLAERGGILSAAMGQS